jgi:hypothetical protein
MNKSTIAPCAKLSILAALGHARHFVSVLPCLAIPNLDLLDFEPLPKLVVQRLLMCSNQIS